MANLSNRTTSTNTPSITSPVTNNTPTNTASKPAFKAGDKVLCPTIGNGIYTVKSVDWVLDGRYISLDGDPLNRLFDTDGTRKDGDNVQLFHNTERNRQAIRQLFGVDVPFYPNHWERKHGYIKDGVFYCPHFHIKKNGQSLDINRVTHSYPYIDGYQVLMHLQAATKDSNDTYELVPMTWQPMPNAVLDDLDGYAESKEGMYE